jgi:hypothetical protein
VAGSRVVRVRVLGSLQVQGTSLFSTTPDRPLVSPSPLQNGHRVLVTRCEAKESNAGHLPSPVPLLRMVNLYFCYPHISRLREVLNFKSRT